MFLEWHLHGIAGSDDERGCSTDGKRDGDADRQQYGDDKLSAKYRRADFGERDRIGDVGDWFCYKHRIN